MKTGYIVGLSLGHNASTCLLKDGEIVFSVEEERLTRIKADGAPFNGLLKVLEYTDKVDYIAVAYPTNDRPILEYTREPIYMGMARKLGLIATLPREEICDTHNQYLDYTTQHHLSHAICAFVNSGFGEAVTVVVDGAGSASKYPKDNTLIDVYETESIFTCSSESITPIYKKCGTDKSIIPGRYDNFNGYELIVDNTAGIGKAYDAVTDYLGFTLMECGKTMGLSAYGKFNPNIPNFFIHDAAWSYVNPGLVAPNYARGSAINVFKYDKLKDEPREDIAYKIQQETQEEVLKLIIKASETSGNKNVCLTGGYALNCVANYYYKEKLNELGINLYVEPNSSDAGTSIGVAYLAYHRTSVNEMNKPVYIANITHRQNETLYLGPVQEITKEKVIQTALTYNGTVYENVDYERVINTIRDKNIVALFQERCENGPRALGNRTLMYDATDPNGKDFVNLIKKREYFRPFAASVLQDDVHEWFDLRGMEDSPSMMYAVNCQPGVEEKIPAVIHVDGTCRIQTVTKEQNSHWYNLIKEFKNQTGVPLLFNTSFNLGGEPLVETIDDALRTLYNSGINYIYFPAIEMMVEITHNDRE